MPHLDHFIHGDKGRNKKNRNIVGRSGGGGRNKWSRIFVKGCLAAVRSVLGLSFGSGFAVPLPASTAVTSIANVRKTLALALPLAFGGLVILVIGICYKGTDPHAAFPLPCPGTAGGHRRRGAVEPQ